MKSQSLRQLASFAVFYLVLPDGHAQSSENHFLIWPQFIVRTSPEPKFSYEGILQHRFLEHLSDSQLTALTNTVYLKPGKSPLYVGADYTFGILKATSQHRQLHWLQPKLEYRPKLGSTNFLFRLMYAHLWIYDLGGTKFKAEDDRIRFLNQINVPIGSKIGLTVNDEVFVLGRKSWNRENRFQVSFSLKMDARNMISTGYFFRWVGSTNDIVATTYENAVTLAYIHTLPHKK